MSARLTRRASRIADAIRQSYHWSFAGAASDLFIFYASMRPLRISLPNFKCIIPYLYVLNGCMSNVLLRTAQNKTLSKELN